jgi:prepilin-type N-terminal cleavage/methylation domain-containing protein
MNTYPRQANRGFNLTELILVIASLAIVALIVGKRLDKAKSRAARIKCVSNLKHCSLGLKIFASDNGDRFPYQVDPPLTAKSRFTSISLTNTTTNSIVNQAAWAHFDLLSNELGSPKVMLCPGNRTKNSSLATDWSDTPYRGFHAQEGFDQMHRVHHGQNRINYDRQVGYDLSISYFVSLNAVGTIPNGILAGDFNLSWAAPGIGGDLYHRNPVNAGLQVISGSNAINNLSFVTGPERNHYSHHGLAGNIALSDGSVQQVNSEQLRKVLRDSTNAWGTTSMHLVIPQ